MFAPGDLVFARGREWVALPTPDTEALHLRPLSGTEADVQKMKEVAKSSLYEMKMKVFQNDANAFLRYTMAKELNQDIVLRLFHAGPGTFWTNMGDKNMNFLMPVPPTEKKDKGAKAPDKEEVEPKK